MTDDKLRPYTFHGMEWAPYRADAKDAYGTCPFCENQKPKFAVNRQTGQYQCWHCKESGNVTTFLQRILDLALKGTTHDQWKELAADRRGIPWQYFRDHQFALDHRLGTPRWLIPVFTARHGLANLRSYRPGGHPLGTSGLPLALYRLEALRGKGPVYLCEGDWDPLALERLRKEAKGVASILGVPGAAVWKEEWTPLFQNREVRICYDNDAAGQDGGQRIAHLLQKTAKSVELLRWPSTVPDKFDVRDLVQAELDEFKHKPEDVWQSFQELFGPGVVPVSTARPGRHLTFAEVSTEFASRTYMDENTTIGLAVMNAVVLSIQLPGDPIWMFIVGPSGSGKTRLLQALMDSPWCVFRSSITPASLVSGYVAEEDPSLIPQLQGKVLVIKDYTEIISMPYERQEEIYAILRGAYDGHVTKTFGNGMVRDYPNCHFASLAGVTDIIHTDNRASLGERFLKFQLVEGRDYDPTDHITAAISGMAKHVEDETFLRELTAQYTNWWADNLKVASPPAWMLKRVVALSQIVSYLRAGVVYSGKGELAYRPVPEVGTRLAIQLMKLAQCLMVVYGSKKIDEQCWAAVEKVALDTCRGWGLDIALLLAKSNGQALLREQIEREADIPSTTLVRRLEGMLAVGTVERQKIVTARPGHPAYGWVLAPGVRQLWKAAKLAVE